MPATLCSHLCGVQEGNAGQHCGHDPLLLRQVTPVIRKLRCILKLILVYVFMAASIDCGSRHAYAFPLLLCSG